MDFIKDKTKCINSVNELVNCCGSGKEIAETIDEFIFDYLGKFMETGESGCRHIGNTIYLMKEVRNLFYNLETT